MRAPDPAAATRLAELDRAIGADLVEAIERHAEAQRQLDETPRDDPAEEQFMADREETHNDVASGLIFLRGFLQAQATGAPLTSAHEFHLSVLAMEAKERERENPSS